MSETVQAQNASESTPEVRVRQTSAVPVPALQLQGETEGQFKVPYPCEASQAIK